MPEATGPAASSLTQTGAIKDQDTESAEKKAFRVMSKAVMKVRTIAAGTASKSEAAPRDPVEDPSASIVLTELSAGGRFFGYDQAAPDAAHFLAQGCGIVLTLLNASDDIASGQDDK